MGRNWVLVDWDTTFAAMRRGLAGALVVAADFKADEATDFFFFFFLELETGVAGVVTAARTIPVNKTKTIINEAAEDRRVFIKSTECPSVKIGASRGKL